jgi:hypothetical protein
VTAILALLLLAQRTYYPVPLAKVLTHTHVSICGTVTGVRKERDGDWHVRVNDGRTVVVVEIIAQIPLPRPKRGQLVQVTGVSRRDPEHGWNEVHPAETITVVPSCQTTAKKGKP